MERWNLVGCFLAIVVIFCYYSGDNVIADLILLEHENHLFNNTPLVFGLDSTHLFWNMGVLSIIYSLGWIGIAFMERMNGQTLGGTKFLWFFLLGACKRFCVTARG